MTVSATELLELGSQPAGRTIFQKGNLSERFHAEIAQQSNHFVVPVLLSRHEGRERNEAEEQDA